MTYKILDKNHPSQDGTQFSEWHELFNALCIERGYIGNSELTFLCCQKTGKSSQKENETVARNLSNWRKGANLPNRVNFRVLTEVLKISQNQELKAHWHNLYRSTLQTRPSPVVPPPSENKPSVAFELFGRQITVSLLLHVALFVGSLTGTVVFLNWYNDDIRALAKNSIIWRKNVTMTVGQKIVVHGKKGACGKMPPPVDTISTNLPKNLATGKLTTGELGLRASNGCNGLTPAREIVFEALAPGRETFFLFENDINVRVISEPGKENYEVE